MVWIGARSIEGVNVLISYILSGGAAARGIARAKLIIYIRARRTTHYIVS